MVTLAGPRRRASTGAGAGAISNAPSLLNSHGGGGAGGGRASADALLLDPAASRGAPASYSPSPLQQQQAPAPPPRKLFVGDLPRDATEEGLRALFEPFGRVEALSLLLDDDEGGVGRGGVESVAGGGCS